MGLLDDLLGQATGGGQRPAPAPAPGGGRDMRRIVMMLLPVVLAMLAKRRAGADGGRDGGAGGGRGGGLGDLLGGGTGGGLGDVLGDMLGGQRPSAGRERGGGGLGSPLDTDLGGQRADRGGGLGGGLGDLLGQVLGGGGGGLGGLLEKLQRSGLGAQASSWVSRGPNQEISSGDVETLLGPGSIDRIAASTGLSREDTALGLAELLPEVVDRVTPQGTVPDDDTLEESLAALSRQFRGGS